MARRGKSRYDTSEMLVHWPRRHKAKPGRKKVRHHHVRYFEYSVCFPALSHEIVYQLEEGIP